MIGVAVLTSKESFFHAKATKKIPGAKETIMLIKKAPMVSNVCNDIVGDICGIVSGGLAVVISIMISSQLNYNLTIVTLIITAIISSLTVGGKAIGKTIAAKKCDNIIFLVGRIKSFLKFKK